MANVGQLEAPGKLEPSQGLKVISMAFVFVGIIAFLVTYKYGAAAGAEGPERAWHAYLLGFFFFTSLSLGGLFFTALQHATSAGWSVNVRRICESFTSFLPVAFVFALIWVFLGSKDLYIWLDHDIVKNDHILSGKEAYLNFTFFAIRIFVFFGLWVLFRKLIVGKSLAQDESGDESLTKASLPVSVAFIVVFALSYTFFTIDSLMSLEPHWFSTIFGVYAFAGMFQITMASMILTILYLKSQGHLHGYVTADHLHDLGKFLFAFTVFWAYIAFSQFMLIWYANLPEETIFFLHRMEGPWAWYSLLLIVGKFIIPFIGLLPRWAKRTPKYLGAMCVWILLMQVADLFWLIYPNLGTEGTHHAIFSWPEVLIFLGFAGCFLLAVTGFLSKHRVVPYRDPRIHESLHHHVVY